MREDRERERGRRGGRGREGQSGAPYVHCGQFLAAGAGLSTHTCMYMYIFTLMYPMQTHVPHANTCIYTHMYTNTIDNGYMHTHTQSHVHAH